MSWIIFMMAIEFASAYIYKRHFSICLTWWKADFNGNVSNYVYIWCLFSGLKKMNEMKLSWVCRVFSSLIISHGKDGITFVCPDINISDAQRRFVIVVLGKVKMHKRTLFSSFVWIYQWTNEWSEKNKIPNLFDVTANDLGLLDFNAPNKTVRKKM